MSVSRPLSPLNIPGRLTTALAPLRNSLKLFLAVNILAIVLLVFITVLLTATVLYDRLLTRQAQETAVGVAEQTYIAVAALMPYGPSRAELMATVAAIKEAHKSSPYQIEIFRGALIDAQYGRVDQPAMDAGILRVMLSGRQEIDHNHGTSRYIYPLIAESSCLTCHVGADERSVLGVVEVRQNTAVLAKKMRKEYTGLFVLYGILTIGLVGILTWFVITRVSSAMALFREKTSAIDSVTDLSKMREMTSARFSFSELDQAFIAVGNLAERLQDVAVDKDILEFEIKILNKFIITSNVVQDWQQFVKNLLVDINAVIDTYALLAFFQNGEEEYELDVFWRSTASERDRAHMELIIQRQLYSTFKLAGDSPAVKIIHHEAAADLPLPSHLDLRDIELHTKSLFLDTPKVGGIVGIGVQSRLVTDPIYHIVLDSVLSTLINLVGSVKAISKYTKDLEYYATRDPLTDLHNQRMFWELLGYECGRAARHAYPFALLVIDLDNFKAVNDRYGHVFGDFFLKQFADVLRRNVRDGDFVARYGGDEFTILLPETARQQAYTVASRIVEGVSAMNVLTTNGIRITSTVSIGMAMYPEHGKTPQDLFLVADNMMYVVKGEGKNSIAVPDMDDMVQIFKNENEINFLVYQALEQQTLLPYFQPIVDFATGLPFAHELLMRIKHPDGRMMPAGEFIKTAEKIGLIYKLDHLLMEKAFQAVSEQGYQEKLFINISPKAFIAPEFLAKVQEMTQKYGMTPDRIVLEVTERDTVSNISMLQKFTAVMKSEGYQFAIDDFGSGYSSFRYLKLFPVDYIKIEGDFIRNLQDDSDYQAYVKSIVTLAKELGIKTVAEHVENEEIFEAARRMGVDFCQGFYSGCPDPSLKDSTRVCLPQNT